MFFDISYRFCRILRIRVRKVINLLNRAEKKNSRERKTHKRKVVGNFAYSAANFFYND